MAWIVSLITIVSVELTVRKNWIGWVLAGVNQLLWLILIVTTEQWGLLPLNAYMAMQSCRGAYAWRKQARLDAGR